MNNLNIILHISVYNNKIILTAELYNNEDIRRRNRGHSHFGRSFIFKPAIHMICCNDNRLAFRTRITQFPTIIFKQLGRQLLTLDVILGVMQNRLCRRDSLVIMFNVFLFVSFIFQVGVSLVSPVKVSTLVTRLNLT